MLKHPIYEQKPYPVPRECLDTAFAHPSYGPTETLVPGRFSPSSKPVQTDRNRRSGLLSFPRRKPLSTQGRRSLPGSRRSLLSPVVGVERAVCLVTAGGSWSPSIGAVRRMPTARSTAVAPARPIPRAMEEPRGPSRSRRPSRSPVVHRAQPTARRGRCRTEKGLPRTVSQRFRGSPFRRSGARWRPYTSFDMFGPAPPAACSIGGTSGRADFSSPRKVNFFSSPSPSVPTTTM